MVPSWPVKPGPNFADFMLKNPLPAAGAAVAEAAAAVEEWSEDENLWEKPVVFPSQEDAAAAAEAAVDENPIDDDDREWADPVVKSESEEF